MKAGGPKEERVMTTVTVVPGQTHIVAPGQTEIGDIVLAGGTLDVPLGATISNTFVAGLDNVFLGTAIGTTVVGGGIEDVEGGFASGTTISALGQQFVGAGGTAFDTTVGSGGIQTLLDATASGTVVSAEGHRVR